MIRLVRLGAPLVALFASLLSRPLMPDPMPIHWGLDGGPDGFAARPLGLFVLPAIALALPAAIGWASSRDASIGPQARRALETTLAATAAFLSAIHGLALGAAAGDGMLSLAWVAALLGVLFVVVGTAMFEIEPNRWIGIRTGATLRDPAIWKLVHDRTAIAFAAAGVLAILAALTLPASVALAIAIVGALAVGLASTAFAWSLGRPRA